MDAAFDGPDEEEDEDVGARTGREAETRGLLSGGDTGRRSGEGRVPGDYDFERDYVGSSFLQTLMSQLADCRTDTAA